MSTPLSIAPVDIQERSSQATKTLYQALGYSTLKPSELKYIALALTEVAAQEVAHNPEFAQKIKDILADVFPKKEKRVPRSSQTTNAVKKTEAATSPQQKPTRKNSPLDKLVPLKPIDMRIINPYRSPDPFLLYDVFGREQLLIALNEFTLQTLREMVASVEEQYPLDPKPNKSKKESMIHFMLDIVARTQAANGTH